MKLGAYIPPDSLVDTRRVEFNFLKARADGLHRVKAMKLRQIVSFGLMVPAPPNSELGQDVAVQLGVTHYEPPMPGEQKAGGLVLGGEVAKGPDLNSPKYDLDAFRKYHKLFIEGEKVWITEKIHGCNARYVYKDGVMHCGSRTEWKKEFPDYKHVTMDWLRERVFVKDTIRVGNGVISKVVDEERYKQIYDKLHSSVTTKNLKYGHTDTLSIAIFDILDEGRWLNAQEAREHNLPWVPYIGTYDYNFDTVVAFSDGPSLIKGANHYREGCVVKPIIERTDAHIGRVCLKYVGSTFLEKDK